MPEHPKSYPLERLLEECCPDDIDSVAEGIARTLEELARRYRNGKRPRLAGHGVRDQDVLARVPAADFATFVQLAASAAVAARGALDDDDEQSSAAAWRILLGPRFPTSPTVSEPSTTRSNTDNLIEELRQRRHVVFTGIEEIRTLKRILERAVEVLDLRIEWDPSSPPELRDHIGVIGLSAARWGLMGAGVGLAIGAATSVPRKWMWGVAVLGALYGAHRGATQVREGWRLRCWYIAPDVPCVEVIAGSSS
ncbi:hypothetical protein OV090_41005 [Nannocystis sp. RBIL2]|uniref:hypothetical protein n=1 Tax=Nannocystis sp. RBIL2 TaxID=2996788 RepID=UPI00226F08B7|nr:hypothetical protein [Nannocystis sp. RBIL2]MCY1071194.1 hypothetical protein [Nannocystis sp. RBIL2]